MVKSAKYFLLKLTLGFLLLSGCLNKVEAYTYQIGDYGFTSISGNWGILTNWKQWDGIGWNTNPLAVPGTSDNVFILSGNTCFIEASAKYCKNLTVESGTTRLYTNLNVPASNRYISLYGNIVCDGNIGNGTTFDNICFNIEGVNDTISGIGVFDCSRMRKSSSNNSTTNLVISMNITLRFDASSSTQIYNNTGNTIFNITVSTGSTLTLTGAGNASMDGIDGNFLDERGGFYYIYGTMVVPGTFYMATNNTNPIYACGIYIGPTGILRAGSPRPVASGLATHNLTMVSGSLFQITGTPFTNSFSFVNNNYILSPGSTIEYSATGPQTVESLLTYANLKISGPANWPATISGVTGSSSIISTAITGSSSANTITVASNIGLNLGMLVSGTGINAGALIIGISGTTITLSVNNFSVVSGTGTFVANTITVGSAGGIQVGMTLTGTGIAPGAAVTAVSGTTIYLSFPNTGVPSGPATFTSDKKASVGATTILGNFTMTGSVFYPNVTIPTVFVGGDWLSTNKVNFFETLSTVVLNGTVNQNIIINPSGNEDFYNLKINKTAGKVFLSSSPATIANIINNLDLTAGNIVTSVTTSIISYYVQLSSAATVSNVSDVSFVEGNCAKQVLLATPITFTFPVGKIAKYRPITISGTPTTTCFMFAEYFKSDPALIPSDLTNKAVTLDHISRCEYWKLRQQGAGAAQNFSIIPSWDTYSACPLGVTNLPTLRVTSATSIGQNFTIGLSGAFTVNVSSTTGLVIGMYVIGTGIGAGAIITNIAGLTLTLSVANSSAVSGTGNFIGKWNDQGNSSTTGSTSSGTITTGAPIGFVSTSPVAAIPFTLSSSDPQNPLPIELLSFTANAHDQKVILNWVTSSEKNNDYFVVERSNNGYDFESVFKKSGAGTSYIINKYSDVDNKPYSGLSYYRLKQVDYDGSATYSKIIAINLNRKSNILVFPNPVDDMLHFSSLENVSFDNSILEIYNTVGQLLIHEKLNISNESNYTVPINTLPSGMYRALIFGDNLQAVHLTFVKK